VIPRSADGTVDRILAQLGLQLPDDVVDRAHQPSRLSSTKACGRFTCVCVPPLNLGLPLVPFRAANGWSLPNLKNPSAKNLVTVQGTL
jgi:hypothetical protein